MQSSARESYLVTEVMTATPQKLQLMLIEAAIRSARRGRAFWESGQDDQACEALVHAQQVVGEMIAGLNREAAKDLVGKMASVYLFVFRALLEANYEHDAKKVDDAIRVLEVERETWRQVCQKHGSTTAGDETASFSSADLPTTGRQASYPHTTDVRSTRAVMPSLDLSEGTLGVTSIDTTASPGLSLEA